MSQERKRTRSLLVRTRLHLVRLLQSQVFDEGLGIQFIIFYESGVGGVAEVGQNQGGVEPLGRTGVEIPVVTGIRVVNGRLGSRQGAKFGGFDGVKVNVAGKV